MDNITYNVAILKCIHRFKKYHILLIFYNELHLKVLFKIDKKPIYVRQKETKTPKRKIESLRKLFRHILTCFDTRGTIL